jgi:hypothetical protein
MQDGQMRFFGLLALLGGLALLWSADSAERPDTTPAPPVESRF